MRLGLDATVEAALAVAAPEAIHPCSERRPSTATTNRLMHTVSDILRCIMAPVLHPRDNSPFPVVIAPGERRPLPRSQVGGYNNLIALLALRLELENKSVASGAAAKFGGAVEVTGRVPRQRSGRMFPACSPLERV